MAQFFVTRARHFELGGAAVNAYLRVKLSAGQIVVAGAADRGVGVLDMSAFTQGLSYPVVLPTAQGTQKYTANGAIAVGVEVYAAASGMVSSTVGPIYLGINLTAATASGDIVEVLSCSSGALRHVAGKTVLSGASPLAIVTGLNTILGASASLMIVGGATPSLDPAIVTVDWGGTVTAGVLDVYPFKFTSNANPTLAASTNAADYVSWVAVGT